MIPMNRLCRFALDSLGCLISVCILFAASPAHAEKLFIAAAADLKYAMDEIVTSFKKEHADDEIEVVYGSAGKFFTQLQQDAPYDIFFSADIQYPVELSKKGLASSEVKPYAFGRIVLWGPGLDVSKINLKSLADPSIKKIAIANPKHAPYGKRAEEALRMAGIWDKVESRLVFGENITQAAQFVQTGNAQIGIIALSIALGQELKKQGGYCLIPEDMHEPLEQAFIITKRAENNSLAKTFAGYMESQSVRAVMRKYGFILPDENVDK